MSTVQQLLDQLNQTSGQTQWRLVGNGVPVEHTTVTTVPDPLGIKPPTTVNRGDGSYYVIVQDNGNPPNQRALMLTPDPNSAVLQNPSVHQGGTTTGGPLKVRQTGVNDMDTDASGKQTPRTDIYTGDLTKVDWNPGGPLQDVPQTPKEPTPTAQLDRLDADGNDATKSGKPTVTLRDPKTNTTIPLPKDPAGTLTTINNTPMVVKPDGTATAVTGPDGKPITVTKDKTQMNVPGIGLVEYDPSKTGSDAYNVVFKTPTGVQAKDLAPQKTGGKIFVPIDDGKGGIVWQEAKDNQGNSLPTDNTYTVAAGGNDPRSPTITLIDQQGNTKVIKKDGWTPPPNPQSGTAVTPNTEAPHLVTIGDDGKPVFSDNPNRLTISEAQKQLAQQLGLKVADGTLSEKAAGDLITQSIQTMTAQAQQTSAQANMITAQTGQARVPIEAATGQLTALQSGAQTGAGLLQNRVTNAMSGFNSALSAMASGKMMNAPAGLGEDLVGGLREWVTGLGGGQPVYDSAAAMVNQAAPGLQAGGDPTLASQAYAALRGAMDLYKSKTGQDINPSPGPFNAPTTAPQQAPVGAAAGTAGGGAAPVLTNTTPNPALTAAGQGIAPGAYNPQASTAALNQRGLLDNSAGRALAAGQTQVLGAPPITQGQYNPIWSQGTPSAVGTVATGPIGTMPAGAPIPPLPYPTGPWYPGAQPFAAPVTVR